MYVCVYNKTLVYVCMYVCMSSGLDLSSSLELQAVMFAQKQQHMEALLTYESIAQTQTHTYTHTHTQASSYIQTPDRTMSRDGIMKSLHGYTHIHTHDFIHTVHTYMTCIHTFIQYLHTYITYRHKNTNLNACIHTYIHTSN